MILDKIENGKLYTGLGTGIQRGLEMLASGELDALPEGRHELEGDRLYASVQEYTPKAPGECRWEAHRAYIDIQYVVNGCEGIGYCPVEVLRVVEPYDAQKDVAFFDRGPEVGSVLKMTPKTFAIFFPQDAHMPMISLNVGLAGRDVLRASERVKKIVLKVALES